MTRLQADGLSVDLPRGWDGQIRPAGASSPSSARTAAAAEDDGGRYGSVLHAATFALPATRGDYGSGAVEVMGGSDVLVCLLEHEPEAVDTALFRRHGLPRVTTAGFSPQSMQRAIAGMSGYQRFFQLGGRAFCLYVVVGSHLSRGPLVREAAGVVSTIHVD